MAISQAREMGFQPVFYRTRKPGKFSPKSKMIYPQKGPKFTIKTEPQKKIAEAGRKCGEIIKAQERFKGSANVSLRRRAMADCIRDFFGHNTIYGEKDWWLPKK